MEMEMELYGEGRKKEEREKGGERKNTAFYTPERLH